MSFQLRYDIEDNFVLHALILIFLSNPNNNTLIGEYHNFLVVSDIPKTIVDTTFNSPILSTRKLTFVMQNKREYEIL